MASGNSLLQWGPACQEPTATYPATYNARNYRPLLEFDPDNTNVESMVVTGVMPQHYDNTTGVTIKIFWNCATDHDTSHHVKWKVFFERVCQADGTPVQNINSDGFDATGVASDDTHVPDTLYDPTVTSIAVTKGDRMDAVVKGDLFRLKIQRIEAGATEASGDVELLFVEMQET